MAASPARLKVAAAITSVALAAVAARDRIRYTQDNRRMGIARHCVAGSCRLPDGELWDDCSGTATGVFKCAGAPDPNGLGYNGQGYTGTLCQHGTRVPTEQALPGDLAFYGAGAPWHHVAIVVGKHQGRIMVVSHGSDAGPFYLPIDYRSDLGEVRRYPLVQP